MRDVLRRVSAEAIRELAEAYGFDVERDESTALAAAVNERLDDGLDGVYEIPVAESPAEPGARTWEEPSDPYNALSVACHVPPPATHGELLAGTTVGVKDIIAVAGVPMQCGSGVMSGFVPSGDATVTTRLGAAGATITAKTNLDEFAGGGRGRSFRGLIRNPLDEDRIAGGSSGGSAAAVAAGIVDVALGTDTGGSVRKPAAFCGLVGLKPTYGLVPLTGVVENTYTLDHVGPLAPSVEAAAAVLEAIAGKDGRDPASMAAAGRDDYRVGGYVDAVQSPPALGDCRIGVATQGRSDEIDETVARSHRQVLDGLEDAGATLVDVELPYLDQVKHVKNVLSYVELAGFWRDGGTPVRRGGVPNTLDHVGFARRARAANGELNEFYRSRLLTGARLMTAHHGRHYTRALAAKATVRAELTELLADVDAVVTPTVPRPAPLIAAARGSVDYDGVEGEQTYGFGRYTKIANVTGVPAMTVPNEVGQGPAVGLQLLGSPFDERTLLGVGQSVVDALPSDN
jgi:amidase/aspartyl-tRNA(Asn)/glutamyl-tRNA(Gln) amidotransferase subunit A